MRLGTRQRAAWLLICLVELLPSHPAYALSFWPTESEWITWPEYCQARYLVSAAGSNSSYSGRIPHSVIKSWEARIGPEVWYSLHHYCAGIVILTRAKFATDSRQREFLNRNALAECQYTLARTPNTHPMHAEIASRVGLVYGELNETDQALRSFDLAINSCPECAVGYQSKAMFHRARGQLDEARQTLETGNAATEGQSADLHYFLGIVLLELKDYTKAVEHARKAYAMGYPLPGLREKLAKAGHPL